jgi:hypothetical protein
MRKLKKPGIWTIVLDGAMEVFQDVVVLHKMMFVSHKFSLKTFMQNSTNK